MDFLFILLNLHDVDLKKREKIMNIGVILSGGVGNRMGLNIPKQYVKVNGKTIINYCLEKFLFHPQIDLLIVGIASEWEKVVKDYIISTKSSKKILFSRPGGTRQYSIFKALEVAKENGAQEKDVVVIHDAARPLVSTELISQCIDGCNVADAIMPAIPVKDTTYLSEDGIHIQSLLNRSHLWSGQAPEAFEFSKYYLAHKNMSRDELLKINGSTELAVKANLRCQMIPGDPMNFKITTPEDLSTFESIVNAEVK